MLSPFETSLIGLLLIVLMFGMGTSLTLQRFREVLQYPRAFLIGTASQFGWMPLLAYLLARALHLSNEAAIGLIVMGTCPGGTTSNLFAHLSRADTALSLSMTAASKVLGIVMMPLSLYLYARSFTSEALSIPYGEVVKTLLVLLVPVALGIVLRRRFGERFARVAEKVGSLAGILVLVTLVLASVTRNAAAFTDVPAGHYVAAILLGVGGLVLGDLAARGARLSRPQRRAVSLETGIQNSPLCFAILVTSFPVAMQAKLLELPLLYALFVLLEATVLTLAYRTRDARREALEQPVLEGASS
jgi:BASS family bile acid:Na+ symporter